jgi:hypothetical protein
MVFKFCKCVYCDAVASKVLIPKGLSNNPLYCPVCGEVMIEGDERLQDILNSDEVMESFDAEVGEDEDY